MVDNLIEFVNQHEYLQLNWEGMDFAVQNKMLFIDVNIVSDIPSRELEDKVHEYFASKNELFDVWGWVEDNTSVLTVYQGRRLAEYCKREPFLSFVCAQPLRNSNKKQQKP